MGDVVLPRPIGSVKLLTLQLPLGHQLRHPQESALGVAFILIFSFCYWPARPMSPIDNYRENIPFRYQFGRWSSHRDNRFHLPNYGTPQNYVATPHRQIFPFPHNWRSFYVFGYNTSASYLSKCYIILYWSAYGSQLYIPCSLLLSLLSVNIRNWKWPHLLSDLV